MTDPLEGAADAAAVPPDAAERPPAAGWVARRHSPRPMQGRWVAVAAVSATVAVVAVVAAIVPPPTAAPAPGSGDGVGVAPAGAHSSSAFCSAGTGTAVASTVYLTNTTVRTVDGVMTTIGTPGGNGAVPTVRRTVAVPPLGSEAVNPSGGMPAGDVASSFVFAGGGVAANQVVGGPNGWSTAPCASQVSALWSFAGGSTSPGNTLTLSLFNPTASQAVVNVSFLTGAGVIAPQDYQGLVVPAGQLVVENVGDFVQNEPSIGTMVTAESGAVVGNELQQWSSGATGGVSLRLGSPEPSTTWRFAQTTALPGTTVNFSLANWGSVPVTAKFSLGLPSATVVPRSLVVPALSMAVFNATAIAGWPQGIPYAVTVEASGPIVVGRSVQAASGGPTPVWGSSSGTVTVATHWLVPGPGVANAPGAANATVKSLAVANPGSTPAQVVVTALGARTPVAMFTVAPHELTVLGAHQVGGLSPFTVSSSQPVNVEEDDDPTGAPGVVSSSGFALGG
ncbi:MAG TPA: DUF5719 family protein [Acidimicrobiales bacterium]|nr:DUF5719 family protein [Acidimicrobiales bacterium]